MKRAAPVFFRLMSLALFLVFIAPQGAPALSLQDRETIWKNNGAVAGIQQFRFGMVDWEGSSVAVEGIALLSGSSVSARLVARRAARSDARRKLLLLLYELRYGLPEKLEAIEVSGQVVTGHIDFQGLRGGEYVVGLTLPLERLMDECVLFGARIR